MSYTSGSSDTALLGMTLGDMFDQTVARYPDNEALVVRHQRIRCTYRQLKAQADRSARALMALGVAQGDRVGIWASNCAEWTIVQLATAKIGTILVNINPSYRLHEVEYALNQSGCTYLIIAPQFKSSNYTQMVHDLAPELANAEVGELRAARLPNLRAVARAMRLRGYRSIGSLTLMRGACGSFAVLTVPIRSNH
jgi:fatty-acyl-CoA synthase